MMLTALPKSANATLPAKYEAAKAALAECSRIDECQNWADRAAALASYARQSDDDTLRKHCDRIKARAIRRCGELLKQVTPSKGGRPSETHDAGDIGLSRTRAANNAGLSERQKVTALRVASVPADSFDQQVESDDPPTVAALAEQGTKKLHDIGDIPPNDYARATQAGGTLRRFAEFCKAHEPARIAKAFQSHEVAELRELVLIVDAWMDSFVINLEC